MKTPTFSLEGYHPLQIQDFLQSILEDRPPIVTVEEGRKTVEIFTAIFRSQRDRRPVKCPLMMLSWIAGKMKAHVSEDYGRFIPYFLLRRMQNEKTNF